MLTQWLWNDDFTRQMKCSGIPYESHWRALVLKNQRNGRKFSTSVFKTSIGLSNDRRLKWVTSNHIKARNLFLWLPGLQGFFIAQAFYLLEEAAKGGASSQHIDGTTQANGLSIVVYHHLAFCNFSDSFCFGFVVPDAIMAGSIWWSNWLLLEFSYFTLKRIWFSVRCKVEYIRTVPILWIWNEGATLFYLWLFFSDPKE